MKEKKKNRTGKNVKDKLGHLDECYPNKLIDNYAIRMKDSIRDSMYHRAEPTFFPYLGNYYWWFKKPIYDIKMFIWDELLYHETS